MRKAVKSFNSKDPKENAGASHMLSHAWAWAFFRMNICTCKIPYSSSSNRKLLLMAWYWQSWVLELNLMKGASPPAATGV